MADILERLQAAIEARRDSDPKSSYVAALNAKGLDAILKKVGEEATETVVAAKGGERDEVVHEVADLWFHCLVLLAWHRIPLAASCATAGTRPSAFHATASIQAVMAKAASRCRERRDSASPRPR